MNWLTRILIGVTVCLTLIVVANWGLDRSPSFRPVSSVR